MSLHILKRFEEVSKEYFFSRYFRVDVRDEMNRLGKTVRMAMRMPRGNVMFSAVFLEDERAMGISVNDSYMQHEYIAKNMVDDFMNVMEIWVRIAKDELKFSEILAIRDIEQRMTALKRYGVEKMLHDAKAQMVNKSKRGNELYKIPESTKIFSQDAYYLKYSDPSTGRIYISGVPPQMGITGDADTCMAWKHGLSTEAYKILNNEA